MSANGRYVAFTTDVTNVAPGLTLPGLHVFRRDLKADRTELVSSSSSGTQALPGAPDCQSSELTLVQNDLPSITANGRFVAFSSCAPNLVIGDTNLATDVFVKDLKTGTTERVSVASDGSQGTPALISGAGARSSAGSISANGRFVTFASGFDNLVENDTNNADSTRRNLSPLADMFVHDRRTGKTELITISSEGRQGTGGTPPVEVGPVEIPIPVDRPLQCANPAEGAISGDGRFVAYMSALDGLAPDDPDSATTTDPTNIFLRDRRLGTTKLVDVSSSGEPSNSTAGQVCRGLSPAISRNGRFISFSSLARNLVPNDSRPLSMDTFVHDRLTRRTNRASVSSTGADGVDEGNPFPSANEWPADISNDGRVITFSSSADNFSEQSLNEPVYADVFMHDQVTGATELVSRGHSEGAPDGTSHAGTVTDHYVAFISLATNLVPGDDEDEISDVYVRHLGAYLGSSVVSPSNGPLVHRQSVYSRTATVNATDPTGDIAALAGFRGADLIGARVVHRPTHEDLYVAIELQHMSKVLPGPSPIFYGLRFGVGSRSYEVRATSLNLGTFGLFDCTFPPSCTKVADLRGGYGTTGMRVVFSLPLDEIGLEGGGDLKNVEAFSGLGTFELGATKVLDRVLLK